MPRSTTVELSRPDDNDVDLPVLTPPFPLKFTWSDMRSLSFTVTAARTIGLSFGGDVGLRYTVEDGTVEGDDTTPPVAGNVTVHVGGGGPMTVMVEELETVWARRRDLSTSDERLISDQFFLTKDDTVYRIRADLGYAPEVDHEMTDETRAESDGHCGLAEVGRRRYFDLVARAIV